jgi:hypothetical protein
VTGGTAISWQNGGGNAVLLLECVSSVPGSAYAIGHCPLQQFNFTGDESFDTVIDFDVPIVLGQEFEYRITVTVQATSGHGYGDLIPFPGRRRGVVGSEPFAGALGARREPRRDSDADLGVRIRLLYAPGPSSAASGALALAVVLSRRRRA